MSSTRSSRSHRSRSSKTGESNSKSGSKQQSVLSYEAERALVKAATRKAELKCRAEALEKKFLLAEEELALQQRTVNLQHKKDLLEVNTEIEIEDAKLAVLDKLESSQMEACSQLDLSEPSQAQKCSSIRRWLDSQNSEHDSEFRGDIEVPQQSANPWSTESIDIHNRLPKLGLQPTATDIEPAENHVETPQTTNPVWTEPEEIRSELPEMKLQAYAVNQEQKSQQEDRLQKRLHSEPVHAEIQDVPVESAQFFKLQHEPVEPSEFAQQVWISDRQMYNPANLVMHGAKQYSPVEQAELAQYDHRILNRPVNSAKSELHVRPHDRPIEPVESTIQSNTFNKHNGLSQLAQAAEQIQADDKKQLPQQSRQQDKTVDGTIDGRPLEPAELPRPQKPAFESSQSNTMQQQQNDLSTLTKLLIKQQVRASLPEQKITIFDGNPLKYTTFIKSFEYAVEDKTENGRDRLAYLSQYTSGEAKTLVNSCLHYSDPEEGYPKAKELLKKRFGNCHKIAQAALKKAREWPEVKDDGKSLSDFSLFLTECLNMMNAVEALGELDHTHSIQALVAKLPYRLKGLWRTKVYDIEEDKHRLVVFKDFVSFIDRQAQINSNPAYGKIRDENQLKGSKKTQKEYSTAKRRAFATGVKHCLYCGEGQRHATTECRKLEKLTSKQKSTFCFEKRLCFGCLEVGHTKFKCKKKESCKKCGKSHPTVLHAADREDKQSEKPNQSAQPKQAVETQGTINNTSCGLTGTGEDTSSPSIIPVVVRSKESGQSVNTYAYLDDGSNAVFCSNKLKNLLCVKGKKTNLQIQTITGETMTESRLLKNLEVLDIHEENAIPLPETYTQESIPASTDDIITQKDIEEWAYLKDVHLPDLDIDSHVGILIGNNVPKAMEPWEVINSEDDGPYAVKTLLGWTVHGVKKKKSNGVSVNRIVAKESIEQQFTQMYNIDFSERLNDVNRGHSKEDQQFLEIAANSIQQKDRHYEMALPFRHEDVKLPNNLHLVQQRAENLKHRFKKNPEFHKEYNKAMEKVLKAGYAEKVPESEIEVESGQVWYVPHHGVYHPQKGKLRVVYDCAATYQGTSLNQELLQGPDLTSSLIGVLLRFRQEPVAMMSDIEGMFYQVKVRKEDRDWLRYLWWPDGDIEKPLQEYRMCTHLFGATSSPACANFALQQNAKDNEEKYDTEVINTIRRNFYVDDCLKSTSTEDKAANLAHDLSDICSKGGFHLTKWVSNSKFVMESVPASERAEEARNLAFDENLPSQKALGLLWHMEPDMFGFKIDIKHKPVTRRGMLSTICSLYDPLGFVSPAILPAKQMLQELCRTKAGWDDDVPEKLRNEWIKWISSLPELQRFHIPRSLKPVGLDDIQASAVELHHFSDASEIGYGMASYLRIVKHDGEVECNLVMSKSRVAPIKKISIPRMELTAATVAVKVDTMLKGELEIPVGTTYFWTDSETVLKYIRNDKARHPVFVANRVAVIRDGSSPQQWRYVPTEANPADHASRGLSVKQFMSRPEWLKGPEFLTHPEKEWPVSNEEIINEDLEPSSTATVNLVKTEEESDSDPVKKLLEYYSDWNKLRRAVAWWLRLKKCLLKRREGEPHAQDATNHLSVDEIEKAEEEIVKWVQHREFPLQMKRLLKSTAPEEEVTHTSKHRNAEDKLVCLDPVIRDGLLKVGGRLDRAHISEDARHQWILPRDEHVTNLIIEHVHKRINHQGLNHVLAELRKKYWIVKARSLVKRLLRKCLICKKIQAGHSKQKMADLPEGRLQMDSPPFTCTGVDYFGPFNIKQGRSTRKRYGVVFTCMTSRAVHIEVAENMDTSSCINAIRRFTARRGQVKELFSDNGSNFVGANTELKKALKEWNEEDIMTFATNRGIKWNFNPPAASHMGGIWERQIRTIRKILQAMLNEQHIKEFKNEEQLITLMCEIESTINSRPLTYISDDPKDLNALTPNDLLLLQPSSCIAPPPGVFNKTDLYSKKRWRQMQYLANIFWKRWAGEYLMSLQERQKWLFPQRNILIGDIVLIVDNQAPRNTWLMGCVLETYPDKNGFVRSAKIRTKANVLTRPIAKLCVLLEAESSIRNSKDSQQQNVNQ